MTDRRFRLMPLAALVAWGLLFAPVASAAPASSPSDRGKRRLPKLFAEATSAVTNSTVRVQTDGRDAALGTIVSADGAVLTKGSELFVKGTEVRGKLTCVLKDGTECPATLVGYHKPTDLALLKVEAKGLTPVRFADPGDVAVGNWIATTGVEPVAVGVVSVKPRALSGLDARIENGNKGFLGVALEDAKDGEGVLVSQVTPGSPAARAKLKAQDVICAIDGKAVATPRALIDTLEDYRPDQRVKLSVKRGEEDPKDFPVTLGSKADIDRGARQNSMGSALSNRRTGFPSVIQHDTVVRPTDCGGPIVDLDGKVIGINIARAGRVETWALPTDVVKSVLKDLQTGKYAVEAK